MALPGSHDAVRLLGAVGEKVGLPVVAGSAQPGLACRDGVACGGAGLGDALHPLAQGDKRVVPGVIVAIGDLRCRGKELAHIRRLLIGTPQPEQELELEIGVLEHVRPRGDDRIRCRGRVGLGVHLPAPPRSGDADTPGHRRDRRPATHRALQRMPTSCPITCCCSYLRPPAFGAAANPGDTGQPAKTVWSLPRSTPRELFRACRSLSRPEKAA